MSAGQMPSGPSFWDSNNRKIIFGVGGSVVGGSQVRHNQQETRHQKWMRSFELNKGLNERSLNPQQYILRASDDGLSIHQIKLELVAWGRIWKGTTFPDPEAFSVAEEWHIRQEPAGKFLRLKERSCTLNVHKSDTDKGSECVHLSLASTDQPSVLTTEQKEEGKATKRLGRRGGSNQLIETQEGAKQLNNGIEIATHRHKYSPWIKAPSNNPVYEVGEAVPDRPILRSYTCTTPQEMGPIPFYLLSIVFGLTSVFLVSYLQEKFLSPATPKNRTIGTPSGEEQESATRGTPQLLLDIFTSYQNKTISKAKAVYILVNFYNLSEIEAVKLLDE